MNYLDHLLTIVIEEASEVIKDACKAQRFEMFVEQPVDITRLSKET